MIQSTAPTLSAALLSPAGTASASIPGAADGFAALLGAAPAPGAAGPTVAAVGDAGAAAVAHTAKLADTAAITAATVQAAQPLPDAIKGALQGLAALTRQAGAALQPDPVAPAGTPVAMPRETAVLRDQAALAVPPETSHIALATRLAAAAQPSPAGAPPSSPDAPVDASAALQALPVASQAPAVAAPAPQRPVTAAGIKVGKTPAADPAAEATPPLVQQAGGKDGKLDGNILPPAADPFRPASRAEPRVAKPSEPRTENPLDKAAERPLRDEAGKTDAATAPSVVVEQAVPTSVSMPLAAILPAAPVLASAAPPPPADEPAPQGDRSAAAPTIAPEVRAMRFEPIEIVRAASAAPIQSAPAPTTSQASSPVAAPISSEPTAEPVAGAERPMPAPQPMQPDATARGHGAAPRSDALAQSPVTAQAEAETAPVFRPANPARQQPSEAGDGDAPAARESQVEVKADAPATRTVHTPTQPFAPVQSAETPASASTGVPGSVTGTAPAGETPHDFDTLVSRMAEAREAAAPHVVRTAFEHAEFGRVAMQLGQDEGGLSVTLTSRDADFAPAVQAAAAAMAGGSAGNTDQPRQDNPASSQQQSGQSGGQNSGQNSFGGAQAQSSQNQNSQGQNQGQNQGQQRSGGQPSRQQDGQASGQQRPRSDQKQGGVYA
ncbi:hypothetical protein [Novosphingobium guangzhouense]|uniref:Flagellar hook-length control protein-like C-terminal domain-containing protein n=1 Tax=Novosphingobium guangzhouense TaxID=1850347 RepID=A0A2K2FZG8_9SPHN|nr:hypothetical protein [Novosphingobium guangzhouense]PNU04186.1 hypothetical protein A8V01_21300 [Novosphingobium guangzhouense]